MRHRRDLPLRRIGDVPPRRRWVFHLRLDWGVVERWQWYLVVTYSWDVVTTFLNDVVETYHWDVLGMFPRDIVGCFIWDVPPASLGRTERGHYVVVTTSSCRVGRKSWWKIAFWSNYIFNTFFWHSIRFPRFNPSSANKIFNVYFSCYKY